MSAAAAMAMRRWASAPLALMVLLALVASAFALTFPALTGRVVDEAGILDAAARASLTQKLADLETKTTDQLVVVTLKSLQGTTIEDFGVQLGRTWKIGQKDKNNGVLLIVAPTERKVRIEVGYGLEGTLTDAVTRLIIENAILPRFKANDFPGGISRGVDDIIQALTGDAADYKERAEHLTQQVETSPPTETVTPAKKNSTGLIMIVILVIIAMLVFCITVSGVLCQVVLQLLFMFATSGSSSSSSSGGGGFSGGGGSFGGGGASGSW